MGHPPPPKETRQNKLSDDNDRDQNIFEEVKDFETELATCLPLVADSKSGVRRAAAELNAVKRAMNDLLRSIDESEDADQLTAVVQKSNESMAQYRAAFQNFE